MRPLYTSRLAVFGVLTMLVAAPVFAATRVAVRRVPDGGVQPQVAVDGQGMVHLVYLRGDPGASDIFYCRSTDDGASWSAPVRVNSQAGSAMAIGTVRGAHLALGREGLVHVAWMGSKPAGPRGPDGATPMLYSRLRAGAQSFEPQRNLISLHAGMDGGGSVAADDAGNVYVAWHAPAIPKGHEQDRRVWAVRSSDDGQTFAPEVALSDPLSGTCGCCGMRLAASGGKVFALYRAAGRLVNRGMHLIEADGDLTGARDVEIAPMKMGVCLMSTSAIAPLSHGVLLAWQTDQQVFWTLLLAKGNPPDAVSPPGNAKLRKYPAIVGNPRTAEVLMAWTEGTGWNKGGAVAWRIFLTDGRYLAEGAGTAQDLPAWDCPAVFASKRGEFVVIY